MSRSGEAHIGAVKDHGGSLGEARRLFPHAPQPFVDLSTGINPHSYPVPPIPAIAFTRLPEPSDTVALCGIAARAYGAASPAHVVAAPGTQILLPLVMSLRPAGRMVVLSPTYAEHARTGRLAGHAVFETDDAAQLGEADVAVVVNPNNPDGRVLRRSVLVDLARRLASRGGLLVVDEAFMDVGPDESICGEVEELPIVVLRSFGKFFGLAGVRLGFAIADTGTARQLADRLGPWAVSGPAIVIGGAALADAGWQSAMRTRLREESQRLDDLILTAGLSPCGGTHLYRFIRDARAASLHRALGEAGLFARRFDAMPDALRIGLPGDADGWRRLQDALAGWTRAQQ